MKRAKISNTKSDAGVVASAMQKYQTEYNRWPATYASGRDTTDDDWVDMMGPKPGSGPVPTNPKRIVFFEPGGGALNADGAFADTWGKPFRFRLDETGLGEIQNPDPDTGGILRGRVVAWSAGPDGDYETWEDNVKSWE